MILSDPRCGYELSVSVASHLACFRFVATNAARIVSFAVALVLFILAVQSRPRKRGEPTPSPVAALSQLITLQTTRLTLQLGIRTLLLTLQTRVPLALVALVLAVVLVPLRHSLQAARAFRVAPADVYLLTSSAVAMAFAVGLVAILAVVQASLLRFVYWTVRSFGGYPKPSSSRPERKRCWRLSGTARLFLGCLSVPICLLIHPAIALLVVLIVQTLDTVSESCRNRDQGNRRTLVKEPGTESGTDDQSVVADGEQTVATEVATAMPRGSTNGGHVSVQDQCEAALQRQSGRLLLAFLNFVMTGPPGFASLPHVLQRWRAPAVLDSLLVVAPIVEALLSPNKRAQSERNGSWSSETFKSYLYVLLGLYTCYEGLLESPLGVAPVFAYAALVELFLSYRDKSWI